MKVGIVDYGLGNLKSVFSAVKRVDHTPFVSDKAAELGKAGRLILPGVGAFGDGMRNLEKLGLIEPLTKMVLKDKKPILGICLGSQLMARESFEHGHHKGLGWIDASVHLIHVGNEYLRVPHVGWDDLLQVKESVFYDGIDDDALFYYVHSFHVKCDDPDIVIGECEYGIRFTAAFHKYNIYATQFHPEKSQLAGLNLLKNFLDKT
jgi:glutamine amidotransferase